jgi:hypothetical protein
MAYVIYRDYSTKNLHAFLPLLAISYLRLIYAYLQILLLAVLFLYTLTTFL